MGRRRAMGPPSFFLGPARPGRAHGIIGTDERNGRAGRHPPALSRPCLWAGRLLGLTRRAVPRPGLGVGVRGAFALPAEAAFVAEPLAEASAEATTGALGRATHLLAERLQLLHDALQPLFQAVDA